MKTACLLAALTLLLCVRPVHAAVTSTIAVQGSISGGGTSVFTKPGNTKDGTSDPFALRSLGDESIANATLMGTTGSLMENAHACSGPPIGNPAGSGNANTRSTVNYAETFSIVSNTLPDGTPVTITLKVAAARSYRATVIQPMPIQAGDAASNGSASIGFNTELSSGNFQGGFGAQQITTGAVFMNTTGIFANPLRKPGDNDGDPNAMESIATLTGTVGGHFSFNVMTQISAISDAVFPITTDGDGQMSLNWGADVVGGLAQLSTSDGTSQFPGSSSVSGSRALANLPPAPTDDVPEPTTLTLLAGPLLALLIRRPTRR
ncbi:MAG: hypothetical protein JWL69_1740 [Phycisphaerales bacterium]|nr:hypothetical protein [Phycisphaerales bacterium]